jgi:hypothetical protein
MRARTDPRDDVDPSPLNEFPVPIPRETSASDVPAELPEPDKERLLDRSADVLASFVALDTSTTTTVTASPGSVAF